MKAKRLPSGSWNVQVYIGDDENGKPIRRSVTRETKAQALYDAAALQVSHKNEPAKMTVRQAMRRYIEITPLAEKSVASVETVIENGFEMLMNKQTTELSNISVQAAIKEELQRETKRTHKTVSVKTVRNEWGFIAAALKVVCGLEFDVKIPEVQIKARVLPDPKVITEALKGTDVELPCALAMWCSLRMSEVRGLMCSSIQDNKLVVERVNVTVNNRSILKELAKTSTSHRVVEIPAYVMELINNTTSYKSWLETGKDGLLVDETARTIYSHYQKAIKGSGIKLTFHDLRHLYASIGLNILKLPLEAVRKSGGWKDSNTLLKVYNETFASVQSEQAKIRSNYLDSLL